ncbi:MAG: TetR/AcrR family transcriptional regulator [Clostridia bacterium]|nr:TetR/AcrR family transcriptional regulator [Clostridia bacterium]
MRDQKKDEIEMAERREKMLDVGFRIFSEHSIEAVPMQKIAEACGVGYATLYRYFNSKLVFAIAIATKKWDEFFEIVEEEYARRGGTHMNAAEELDFYLGCYILLYREHRDILSFNQNFNSYVTHEHATPEQLQPYGASIMNYVKKFHFLYEKGKTDGTIRTDLPENKMFVSTMHIMLAVTARFAEGVLYRAGGEADLTEELLLLKRSLMAQFILKQS